MDDKELELKQDETLENKQDETLENKQDETLEVENNKEEEKKPTKSNKKKYTGDLRGFKTYEEAINYPYTEAFSKLDRGCQEEYKTWLKTIM